MKKDILICILIGQILSEMAVFEYASVWDRPVMVIAISVLVFMISLAIKKEPQGGRP